MLGIFFNLMLMVNFIKGAEVCYDRLGCFTDDYPYSGSVQRPLQELPSSPESINTRFLLWTRRNHQNYQEITAIDPATIQVSNFNASLKTCFIIHGFIDKGDESWLFDMCKEMLDVEDVNCICVDWKKGSRTRYLQAVHNIRVVGAEVAYFIDILEEQFGYSASRVHIIGHSLGSHAAGEAGKRKPGIARITGLDPAEPFFQNTPTEVRLDPSDATFVDVLHTDGAPIIPYLGFGMIHPCGHIDFYPNGGEFMPGCDRNIISTIIDIDGIWQGTRDFVACNHLRAYKYYTESIKTRDGFIGFPCNSYGDFNSGSCSTCPQGGCPLMGHYADTSYDLQENTIQKFYLNTGDLQPFARWRYHISIKVTGHLAILGYIKVALYGTNGNTRQYQIAKTLFFPGSTHASFVDVETDVGTLTKIKFLWNNNLINPLFPKMGAERITVHKGSKGSNQQE
ncbi:inactive pancreatic lipase-related protein 1-like [Protopterus annectens]|uniref:inactive pancreatic lipase-related protein 1-like n=1 Tax=Protopterus annectens TaxID=7888 RepID=UPI001CFBBCC2|nr:inactive pancreatic lipase-related protein 1-like [Protopterus annectens]